MQLSKLSPLEMFSLPFLKAVTDSRPAVETLPTTLCDGTLVVGAGFRRGRLISAAWVVVCTVEFPQNLRWIRK